EERLSRRPAARSVAYRRAFEVQVGPGPKEALWKLSRRPPVAPQPKSEGAWVGSVKLRPRRGWAAGSMDERLPRRPAAKSVVCRRIFEAGLSSPIRAEDEGCSAFPLPSRTRARVARDLGGICA
ncbi:unnamed protein product, partial [Ectocarpus sp. 13 AM-2016]